jgi:type I restriction enzyme, S subunit
MTNRDTQTSNEIAISDLVEVNPSINMSDVEPDSVVSFIPMADVSNSGFWIHKQSRRYRDVRSGFTAFQEDDVLFAKITPSMENGKGCHAVGLVNGFGFGTTEFHVLRAKGENSPRFLFHWLQSEMLRQKAEAEMTGTAGQQRVPASFFSRFKIVDLEPNEQQLIADILDTIDAAIQHTQGVIDKLKEVRAGLLHDLLTYGIDANGDLRENVENQHTPYGDLPADWRVVQLKTVGDVKSGLTLGRDLSGSQTVEVPYMRVFNVQDGYLDLSDIKTIEVLPHEVDNYRLEIGDVLMNEGGDFDKLGRGTVWQGEIELCLHQNHVFRVRTDQSILNPMFLSLISGSNFGKKFFVLSSKQSTNLASINSTQLKSFPVPLPHIDEQNAIVEIINGADTKLDTENTFCNKLQVLKQGLTNDLLTGTVRVTQLIDSHK